MAIVYSRFRYIPVFFALNPPPPSRERILLLLLLPWSLGRVREAQTSRVMIRSDHSFLLRQCVSGTTQILRLFSLIPLRRGGNIVLSPSSITDGFTYVMETQKHSLRECLCLTRYPFERDPKSDLGTIPHLQTATFVTSPVVKLGCVFGCDRVSIAR